MVSGGSPVRGELLADAAEIPTEMREPRLRKRVTCEPKT